MTDPSVADDRPSDVIAHRAIPRGIVGAIRQTAARAVPGRRSAGPSDAAVVDARAALRVAGSGALESATLADLGALFDPSPTVSVIPSLGQIERAADRPGQDVPGRADLDDMQSQRLTGLAQELRATLALISGYSQSVLHLELDEESRQRYLEQLPVAAAHLADLSHEILELSVPREDPKASQPVRLHQLPR